MGDARATDGAGTRVFLRPPTLEDAEEFVMLVRASQEFLRPWVDPPSDREAFSSYVEKSRHPDFKPLLICLNRDRRIVGAVNLSQIYFGNFCSAYVGFWIGEEFAGLGLMRAALLETFRLAFGEMGLHRLEINVQPTNERCLRLLNRLGLRREGYSPRYLRIAGVWADHERWAVCAEDVVTGSE